MNFEMWNDFKQGKWQEEIDVANFIQENYTEYLGDDSFLEDVSEKSKSVWDKCLKLFNKENKNIDEHIFKSMDNVNLNCALGYIKGNEKHSFLDEYEEGEDDGRKIFTPFRERGNNKTE